MEKIRLLEKTAQGFSWPQDYLKYKPYLECLAECDLTSLIKNVKAKIKILQIGNHLCPICITDRELDNSSICSIIGTIQSVKDSWSQNWIQKKIAIPLFDFAVLLIDQLAIDRAIIVDCWLFSGNSYPEIEKDDWIQVTQFLIKQFPNHPICFNSLNSKINFNLINELAEIGYKLLPWKKSVLIDTTKHFSLTNSAKNDFRLEKKSIFQKVIHHEMTSADYPRMIELYNMLFLEKHSIRNPQITEKFIKLCHENSILHFIGLRNPNGILEGVIGIFVKNGIMHDPLIGYNLQLPQTLGIYRILKAMELRYAMENKLLHNSGTGAIHFKKLRGGTLTTDFLACFYQHLPAKKRWAYTFFRHIFRMFHL